LLRNRIRLRQLLRTSGTSNNKEVLCPLRPVLSPETLRWLPWVVAIAFFMQSLDGTILNTALPDMALDLTENPLRMQGVIVAYMLTVALLIPASGWIADRFGTKKIFFSAILLFSFGSLLCALSGTLNHADRRTDDPGSGRRPDAAGGPAGGAARPTRARSWCGSWVLSPFPACSAR
jgi:MFS family permease